MYFFEGSCLKVSAVTGRYTARMCCCFGAQENRDLSQSLLGDQKHVTKVESNAFITGMKEVSDGVFSSHTEYQLQLHVTGAVIPSCWKRYSDFEAMHLRMMEDQPHMLAAYSVVLPPKNIGNARDAKEMRRQHLEEYMRRVVASASLLYSNHLQHFVDSEPPIVEQLAACATDQQRNIKELWKARLKVPYLKTVPLHFRPTNSARYRRTWLANAPRPIPAAHPPPIWGEIHRRRNIHPAASLVLAA